MFKATKLTPNRLWERGGGGGGDGFLIAVQQNRTDIVANVEALCPGSKQTRGSSNSPQIYEYFSYRMNGPADFLVGRSCPDHELSLFEFIWVNGGIPFTCNKFLITEFLDQLKLHQILHFVPKNLEQVIFVLACVFFAT